jgi:hypothetical protein
MGKLFWADPLPSFEPIERRRKLGNGRKIKESKFNLGIFYFEEDEADEQMMNLDEFLSF